MDVLWDAAGNTVAPLPYWVWKRKLPVVSWHLVKVALSLCELGSVISGDEEAHKHSLESLWKGDIKLYFTFKEEWTLFEC